MTFAADDAAFLDRLDEELRLARAPTPKLFSKLVATMCTRVPRLNTACAAARIENLAGAGACADAALLLVELAIPAWKVRRLVREDGEWLCSLSRRAHLPIALDEPAEATHESLPLAILRAFLQVHRNVVAGPCAARVPQVQPMPERMICCDNFA